MRILVTGGAGFIGGNFIIKQLQNENNKILNFDKLTYAGNLDTLKNIENNPNYEFKKGDICNADNINTILDYFKPEVIINFAAESHVDRSIDGPSEFIKTNIVGTSVLLEECLNYFKSIKGKKKDEFVFMHVSTDEVYGSLSDTGYFTETTPYAPKSPYSASKASSDHLVRAWWHTYGFPIIITNCSNNYGPYQFPEKLIPLMIINCLFDKKLPIYGSGNNVRDWLYVEDHCDALQRIMNNGTIGETYNIGGNNQLKNIDVVKIICDKMNALAPHVDGKKYEDQISYVEDRPGHDYRYAIDASKIERDLGWKPKVKFSEGIEKTIIWYLNNRNWWIKIYDKKYKQERLGII